MKYLDGRKKAYSHLFTEISSIPDQYKQHFVSYMSLLPRIYRGRTDAGKPVTAPERDSAKPERASVLEKLSDAKKQEKQRRQRRQIRKGGYSQMKV